MDIKHWVPILGIAGIAAYALGRTHRIATSAPVAGAAPPPDPTTAPTSAAQGTFSNGAYGAGWPAASQDVSGDVTNSEKHILITSDIADPYGAGSSESFFRHCWLPASKFSLGNLSPYQLRCAFGLLGGSLHRNPDLEFKYRDYVFAEQQRATQSIAGTIFATVGSIIPIVGKVFSMAVSAGVNTVNTDIAHDASQAMGMFSSIHTSVDLKNLDPPAQMLMQPSWRGGGEQKFDMTVAPWVASSGVQTYDPSIALNGKIPAKYLDELNARWPLFADLAYLKNPNSSFVPPFTAGVAMHKRFWTVYQYGCMLPWVCDEFFGPGSTTKDQVNSVAACYKVLDYLTVITFPNNKVYDPTVKNPNDGIGYNYFYYHNKYLGDICGTIFPPIPGDDTYIVDSGGHVRDFTGQLLPQLAYVPLYGAKSGQRLVTQVPVTLEDWATQKATYDGWVRDDATAKAATVAANNAATAAQHTRYWDSYFEGRNLDTGETWQSINFTWDDLAVMPLDVMKHLGYNQLAYLGFYDVDRKRVANTKVNSLSADRAALVKQLVQQNANMVGAGAM